jgi:3-hydroxyisobutyrate dehydrogenase-like beta-hydroxyacid dehydrogenase
MEHGTSRPVVGFIGFGEAGSTLARGLRSAGIERIFAYDVRSGDGAFGSLIQERAREAQTTIVDSSSDLTDASTILFSTVTSSSALDAAMQTAPFLHSRHTYADLNSVSPALKQDIERVVSATGATFVEAAVMAPVQPSGHKVPMLLGGAGADAFAATMRPFGMRLEVLAGAKVGSAAAVKMCRSIVVKGLEALLLECVMAATKFDADGLVFASLDESFPGIDWKKLADYTSGRVVVHGERRAREMEEVAETLRAIGIDPIMAEATARRQDWSAEMDLKSHFGPEGPKTYQEVVDVIAKLSVARQT